MKLGHNENSGQKMDPHNRQQAGKGWNSKPEHWSEDVMVEKAEHDDNWW